MELFILYNNPNRIPQSIVCDTRNPTVSLSDISTCALISNFCDVAIYRLGSCRGKNVLLKYKGGDSVETRLANSIGRIGAGIFSKISRPELAEATLDFSTNIDSADFYFSTTSSLA